MKWITAALTFLTKLFAFLGNDKRLEIKDKKLEISRPAKEQKAENRAERLEDVGDRRDKKREGKKEYGAFWRIKKKRDEADK